MNNFFWVFIFFLDFFCFFVIQYYYKIWKEIGKIEIVTTEIRKLRAVTTEIRKMIKFENLKESIEFLKNYKKNKEIEFIFYEFDEYYAEYYASYESSCIEKLY